MHDNKEKLMAVGRRVLEASKTELYVAMRFLDLALNSLDYEMDLSIRTVGTDSRSIRYNPSYLIQAYREDSLRVNRLYLHMILHCVFRHMFGGDDKDDKELWDLSCDIAVTSIIDSMDYRCVHEVVPDQRQAVYDRMGECMKVLTAEGIYKEYKKHPLTYFEMEDLKKYFTVDDHAFWEAKHKEEQEDKKKPSDGEQDQNDQDKDKDQDKDNDQDKQDKKEQEDKWREISEKMRTNIETYSKDATDLAGSLYDHIRIATRQKYDYRKFLKKFTTLHEEMRIDLDSFDYIYYTYGFVHYGNMPLIEPLEYKESRKVEEFAIVLDTSESCSGEYIRRFLEETFSILAGRENFFRKMNVHIIQCDAAAQVDDIIRSEDDMRRYMKDFKVIGFGGTDFRPAFAYVEKLIKEKAFKHLKGLLYFTDGYGKYPVKRPPFETAFVFLEENYNDRQVPPWAVKLILGPEELGIRTA